MNDSHSCVFANICKENAWKVFGNFSESSDRNQWVEIDYESLEYARSLVTESLINDEFEDYIEQIFTTLKDAELTIIDTAGRTPLGDLGILVNYFVYVRLNEYMDWTDWPQAVPDSESEPESDDESDDESD